MNENDPTLPLDSFTDPVFLGEVSVEDVAQLAASEAQGSEATVPELAIAGEPVSGTPLPAAPAILFPPLSRRPVSGRYQGSSSSFRLELRIDVDRIRPMRRVSGDYFMVSGGTVSYFGSFVVSSPTVTVTSTTVTIQGLGQYTFPAGAPRVKITIPRRFLFQPPAPATLQHSQTNGTPGTTYVCVFESMFFRTVEIEEDFEQGVTPFASYGTGSLPSGGPARNLSVAQAFSEAGLEMRSTGRTNGVSVAPGGTWSDAELHNAMQAHFSRFANQPQWKVWLFHALRHDFGPGLLGIMFDQQGRQRQGCATFYQTIGGTAANRLRDQLYTCTHELGHCFNLFHSFHKSVMSPPQPNRPAALSWMNYPPRYPGGSPAFWAAFPFQFDDPEVIHLRHGFRNNVIMGGADFGIGAALEAPEEFAAPLEDRSGLELVLEGPSSVLYGEPVWIEVKLYNRGSRPQEVHDSLHPRQGVVRMAIQKPGGDLVSFEPIVHHCVSSESTVLDANRPSLYESVFLGFGKDGFSFAQPGTYQIRALYPALDGSRVVSNVLSLRVRNPLSPADEEVAELLSGEEQGLLFALRGSDSKYLQAGNEALDRVLEQYGDHPLAVYARYVKGYNLAREFKDVQPDGQVSVRPPQPDQAEALLQPVVEASVAGQGLNNISLNRAMRQLARAQVEAGSPRAAQETLKQMVDIFSRKALRPHVTELIRAQAAEVAGEAAAKRPKKERRPQEE
jgi:hypothetical protein